MACIDDENGEVYLTAEEERSEILEGKILLYSNFTKILEELIDDSEKGSVSVEDLKIHLNDLKGELASV